MFRKPLFVLMFLIVVRPFSTAQTPDPGIHVSGGTAYVSQVSSNIGTSCNATGQNSFAGGYYSNAYGSCSFAFGNGVGASQNNSFAVGSGAFANASSSIAIGFDVATSQSSSILIGSGYSSSRPLIGSASGILLGMGSTKPTLFISQAGGENSTGKVAIGDVTPQAKLHIRSDQNEDAGVIVVPANLSGNNSFLQLRDSYHYLIVDGKGDMELSSGTRGHLGITSMNFSVDGGLAMLGLPDSRMLYFSSEITPSISSNAIPVALGYNREVVGPSYAMEFGDNAILIRTATFMQPRGDLITNWHNAVKIGVNQAITLNGKVGVNIDNTTDDYALAVDGGVITTKVHIQEVEDWEDRVFGDDYRLMPLDEVEAYVAANRHLPGIPSEAEVKANGFDMAEMQAALLGKIEELTLHVIRQQQEMDSLRELVTVHFGYDTCGNRTSRMLQFQREDEGKGGDSEDTLMGRESQWYASLSDTFVGAEVCLFPNPTEGGFFLSLTGGEITEGALVTLFTLDGRTLEERTLTGVKEEFDLGAQPAGIYLLRLSSDCETKVWKVIKRN